MYTFSLRRSTSLVTLITFMTSLCSPFLNIAHATSPDVALGYSSNPTGTGTLTITATYTDTVVGTPLITIDQPGWMDVFDAPMTDLGSGTIFTYDYTVNMDDGSGSVDGVATVSLTGAYNGSGEIANPASNATFTITTLPPPDTTPPVVTLSGSNISVALSGTYMEPGASWTDNVDGSGDTFTGTYGTPGSFAVSGSVDTNTVGVYYIDYMKVDNAGNSSGATRRVDVVSPANLRNATVAPPSNDKIYSNGIGQEVGRFGVSAGIDPIRLENIDLENIGTSYLSNLASYSTGVELREVSGNTLLAVGTISGQTISFSGVNSITPGYTTTNYKVVIQAGPVEPYYGQTLRLSTNSGMISIVKDADSSPLAVDDSMLSAMKLYTASITVPAVVLTGHSGGLQNGAPIGKIHVTNLDSNTGMTISGVTLLVSMTGGVGSFVGSVCLRDIGSISVCGGVGTTTGQTITETGGVFIFDTRNSTLSDALTTLTPNTGHTDYEVYIDNSPVWTTGNVVSVATQRLEYQAGGYDFSQNYVGVGSASMIVSYGMGGDTTPPVVTLSGSSTVNVEYGNDYTEDGASWTDNVDGSGNVFTGSYGTPGSFALSGSVNTGSLGTYSLDYKKVDNAGNATSTGRTVNVVDTTAPTVTLSGADPDSIIIGSTYTDPGASWNDIHDGSGTIPSATSGSVNTGALGTYILEYSYTDGAGNTGSTSRTVNVIAAPDNTPPVVVLSGSMIEYVEFGNDYMEPGVSWTDNVDGSGDTFVGTYGNIGSFAVSGSVNTGALGTYTLEYLKVDSSGNSSGATRSVVVRDTTPPTASVTYSTLSTTSGSVTATLTGASELITITNNTGNSNYVFSSNGSFTFTFQDASGNTGSVVASVANIDTTAPVITLSGSSTVNVEFGSGFVDDGASWTDNVDGSGFIATATSGSVNTGALGTYMLEYSYTDGAGNSTSTGRTVNVVDTTAPTVTLIGSGNLTIYQNSIYTESGASWSDVHDGSGNLSGPYSGLVNTGSLGTYVLSYRYIDSSGNTGSISRTVNVIAAPDTTPPVITLIGSGTMIVAHGSIYVDSGATALDNVDGDITASIMTGGTVDTSHTGTYIITYDVTDAASNPAVQVTRSVTVADMTGPSVIPVGGNFVTINQGASYTESGATWTDNVDGSGFLATPYTGAVDINTPGVYILEYRYTDGGGNVGMGFRTVTVTDALAPVVTLSGSATVSVEYGNDYSEDGASWTDNVDGSGNVFTGSYGTPGSFALSGSVNTGSLGTYVLEYLKVDDAGNSSGATRTVVVEDTTAPVVTLSGAALVSILVGSGYTDVGASWTDLHDGAGVIPSYNSGFLDTNSTGSYTIAYEYTDISGNTGSVSRTVNVLSAPDTTPPVVTLSGSATVNVEYGNDYSEDGASWTDNIDGSGYIATATSGSVNTGALGTYILEYSYTDGAGNTGSTSRTVSVIDTTNPVVTLSGSSTLNVEYGNAYVELGASWIDLHDGAGVILSATSGAVNTGVLGNYTLEYTYTDISGNTGTVTRTVSVVDTTAPVVTLSGSATVNVEYGNDYSEDGASWTDAYDGSGLIPVATTGSVNTGTLGTYTLGYRYIDSSGNTGSVSRTVNVVDTTVPVVTLVGSGMITLLSGSVFSDSGATWTDLHDGAGVIPSYNSGTLDVNTVGTYTIGYNYVDSSGNTGSTSRSVNIIPVPDTTPPVITLSGSATVNVEYGNDFIDDGASWTDNVDGSGFIPGYTSGSVNTGALGTYTVSYEYTDSSSNVGTGADRTIIVQDTTAPSVVAVGGSLITLVVGDTYTESGASWTDAYDGSGTVGVYSGSVDTNTVGTYMIEYRYTDSSSNVGIAFRTVNVLAAPDTTPPVITLSGAATVNVEFGSGFVDDGASWTDNVDGSGFISGYNSGSVNTGALGTYIVSYEYTDSSSNVGTGAVRTIHVVDTTPPTASVTYSTLSTTSGSVTATLTGASESITITNNAGSPNYVFSSNGSFTFTFQDASGNTGSVVANVANIDTTAPVITLLGTSPTTVTQGTTYTDMGVVATDNVDGNITGMVTRSGSVNTSLTGSYTLVYTVSDSVGNQATPVSRIVNVVVPAPVVIAPSTGGGGGGGGNIIGGVPLVPSANQATSTVSSNPNMQLGITALERLLRNTPEGVHTEAQTPLSTTSTQDIIVSDIDNSDYQEAITAMIESGYVKNTKKFDPERPMTRNEFMKVLSLAYGFEEMSDMDSVMKFRDVGNSEFRKYIVFGIVMGWINPDMPSFRGDDSITYGEAIKLLDAAQGKTEANAPVINKDILSREHGVSMIYEEIVVQ